MAFGLCFQLAGAADADGQGRAGDLARAGGRCANMPSSSSWWWPPLVTPPDVMTQMILFFAVYRLVRGVDLPGPPDREAARGGIARRRPVAMTRPDGEAGGRPPGEPRRDRRSLTGSPRRWSGWPPRRCPPPISRAEAFVWHTAPDRLEPVARVNRVDIGASGRGRPVARYASGEHPPFRAPGCPPTTRFCGARGEWGNQAWSRRSMPQVRAEGHDLKIVELAPRGPAVGPAAAGASARAHRYRFLLFCDDLSLQPRRPALQDR